MEYIHLPVLLLIGLTVVIGFYMGKNMKYIKLPSIIGYMIFGVVIGPSLLNLFTEGLIEELSFITELALGFVALTIGIELKLSSLRKLGKGIIYVILIESFGAFIIVFSGVYLLTHSIPMALIFGAIAPASAPAGTVAVIHEYKAKGPLTKALYAVVGFDDGLGIIIFGFAAAFARSLLLQQTSAETANIWLSMLIPIKEVLLSLVIGGLLATIFSLLSRRLKHANEVFILIFGFIIISIGLCEAFHLSLILTNMIIGMLIINTQPHSLVQKLHDRLPIFMPLLFILFFTLAGANLHLSKLPSLGLLGIVYVVARTTGLVGGSYLGSILGKTKDVIRKYLGYGILSQAGVAIGLALIVKHEFSGLGKVVETVNNVNITTGDKIGAMVITTVTATCIFFEIIGPVLTKIVLEKAGETNQK